MKKIDITCIIDDDPIFIFGTKKIMEVAKFCNSFLIYNNGQIAITALQKIMEAGVGIPDVILLDLNMPVMDGWEFLEEFIKIPNQKQIQLFIVTSSIYPEDIERAKQYQQVSNYIVKPISRESLGIIMETIVENKQQ